LIVRQVVHTCVRKQPRPVMSRIGLAWTVLVQMKVWSSEKARYIVSINGNVGTRTKAFDSFMPLLFGNVQHWFIWSFNMGFFKDFLS